MAGGSIELYCNWAQIFPDKALSHSWATARLASRGGLGKSCEGLRKAYYPSPYTPNMKYGHQNTSSLLWHVHYQAGGVYD